MYKNNKFKKILMLVLLMTPFMSYYECRAMDNVNLEMREAVKHADIKTIKSLLKCGADIHANNDEVLMFVIVNDNPFYFREFINLKNNQGLPCYKNKQDLLRIALMHGSHEIIIYLMKLLEETNELVKFLKDNDTDTDKEVYEIHDSETEKNLKFYTHDYSKNYLNSVEKDKLCIIDYKGKFYNNLENLPFKNYDKAIHYLTMAVLTNQGGELKLLYKGFSRINKLAKVRETINSCPLLEKSLFSDAVKKNRKYFVQSFIKLDCDINKADNNGRPIDIAIKDKNQYMINLLLTSPYINLTHLNVINDDPVFKPIWERVKFIYSCNREGSLLISLPDDTLKIILSFDPEFYKPLPIE